MKRSYIGIDISEATTRLSQERLKFLIKTESHLLKKGKDVENPANLRIVDSHDIIVKSLQLFSKDCS